MTKYTTLDSPDPVLLGVFPDAAENIDDVLHGGETDMKSATELGELLKYLSVNFKKPRFDGSSAGILIRSFNNYHEKKRSKTRVEGMRELARLTSDISKKLLNPEDYNKRELRDLRSFCLALGAQAMEDYRDRYKYHGPFGHLCHRYLAA